MHVLGDEANPPSGGLMAAPSAAGGCAPSAVIFDVGNVLYGWDPDGFLVRQIGDDDARMRFVDDVRLWEWHETLDGGRAFADAAAELSGRFPQHAHLIAAWGERFGETITDPVPGVHAIVDALYERGVPLYAITNFSADFWPPFHAKERAFFEHFRDIVVSGEEKLLKPDPAIYRLALDRFGLQAHDALFIDDRPINVEGAEAVGIRAYLFTSAEDLRLRLVSEGLL